MSANASKVFCDVCGFMVKQEGHEARCRVKIEGSSVLRSSAWLGDAEVAVDVRTLVLLSGSEQKTWQVLFQGLTDRVYQSVFYSNYRGRKVKTFGTSEHSIAQAFESTYYFDDRFRSEFLQAACRDLAVKFVVSMVARSRGVDVCERLASKYWTEDQSIGSGVVVSESDGSGVDLVGVAESVSDNALTRRTNSVSCTQSSSAVISSGLVARSELGAGGPSREDTPAGVRATAVDIAVGLKVAAISVDRTNFCVSAALRVLPYGDYIHLDKVADVLNVADTGYKCRGCKDRFLTKKQLMSHLLFVMRKLTKLYHAHTATCHSLFHDHKYAVYKCADHEGDKCMFDCGMKRGYWKLHECSLVRDGDVGSGRVRSILSLCLSEHCCVCDSGSSEFRKYGSFGCGSCEACMAKQLREL